MSGELVKIVEELVDRRFNERFAELLGNSEPVIAPRPAARKWTEEEKREVIRDALSGMSIAQMARKHGRTVGAIRLRLYGKKAGLLRDHAASLGAAVRP